MDIQALSLAGAALVIGGSYINARYGIGTDIREIKHEKNGVKRLFGNFSQLGEGCTIYNVFSRADPTSNALWFEGQTWTYGQLKHGMCSRGHILILTNKNQRLIDFRLSCLRKESRQVTSLVYSCRIPQKWLWLFSRFKNSALLPH